MKKSDLGKPITRYHLQELRWKDLLLVFLPLLLVALAPTMYGFWRTLYGYSNFGPAAAASWGRNWFYLGSILVMILLFYTLSRIRKVHTWIEVFPWGLYFHFPAGRKRILTWEDIVGITSYSVNKTFLGMGNKARHYLVLVSRRYPPLTCHPQLKDLDGLKRTVKKQVYNLIKPKLLAAFQAGETLPFGAVSIAKSKLIVPKTEIPWEYIEGINVQKGFFTVRLSAEKQIQIPIRKIINLELLIHIIKTEI
jgi:hypothetical protein